MSTGKKRFWSDDEKREICGQARVAGASVAQVARRYAMNANLIHKWMRDPRFEPLRFYRRLFSSSQATLSSVFMFA
jgi:acyl-CoA synthetase (NDP forming)